MLTFFDALPLWALGVVIVGACAVFGIVASTVSHRAGWTLHETDIDSGTVLHAFVGLTYAVVLGLIVVNVQEDHDDVRQSTIVEAGALSDIDDTLAALTSMETGHLRDHLRRYVDLLINDEWPSLRQGRESTAARQQLATLAMGIVSLQPATPGEAGAHRSLIEELDTASDARRNRNFVGLRGINSGTWAVVILGAVITIGFASLFPLKGRARVAVVGLTAGILGLMLALVVATSRPLRGQLGVGPAAFFELAADLDADRGLAVE